LSDGKRLVSGSLDGSLRTWDVKSGKLLATLGVPAPVHSFALSPDTRSLLICTGTTVKAMDAAATKPLRLPSRDKDALPGAAWLGDDGYVFVTRDSYHFYNTL